MGRGYIGIRLKLADRRFRLSLSHQAEPEPWAS